MSARLPRQRWWVACLYCLAVVMAQGFHTHHAPTAADGHAVGGAACGSGHAADEDDRGRAPAFSTCSSDCPSCDFALSHQATLADRADAPEADRLHIPCPPTPADPDTSPVRPRGRAPPLRMS